MKPTQPATLVDTTAATAGFGMIGAVASISAGHNIVANDGIEDPSAAMAHEIATAYAAAHGGTVADAPVPDAEKIFRTSPATLASKASGANYVVEVESPGMNIIYFSFDWTHFDMLFMTRARIIDTSTNKVVSQGHCFVKSEKTPTAPTHAELLADNGALLKQLIARKSQACLVKLKADLKL